MHPSGNLRINNNNNNYRKIKKNRTLCIYEKSKNCRYLGIYFAIFDLTFFNFQTLQKDVIIIETYCSI